MAVLVTGGAGYIGSHVLLALQAAGRDCVTIDNLITGHRDAVPPDVPFVQADIADRSTVRQILRRYDVDAVIHLAASLLVPESVENPLKYFNNNTVKSFGLIEDCHELGVRRFVFSSTAAVYGQSDDPSIGEDSPVAPINAYGQSKLAIEFMLREVARAHGLLPAILRYFNVAGADPLGRSGPRTVGATHLIKVACEAARGHRDRVTVFGSDYDTPDGTGIRDYIHVSDLADIHVRALQHLERTQEPLTLNCGYGHGASVLEVLRAVERVAGGPLPIHFADRRPGDPPRLVADPTRLRNLLEWQAQYDDLDTIVRHALDWEDAMAPASVRRSVLAV